MDQPDNLQDAVDAFVKGQVEHASDVYVNPLPLFDDKETEFIPEALTTVYPLYYQMLDEDDLIPGRELKNGMIVQVEPPTLRGDNSILLVAEEYKQLLLKCNRWCTITKLHVDRRTVTFIGVYEDGSKRGRSMSVRTPWYVKKSSIPKAEFKGGAVAKQPLICAFDSSNCRGVVRLVQVSPENIHVWLCHNHKKTGVVSAISESIGSAWKLPGFDPECIFKPLGICKGITVANTIEEKIVGDTKLEFWKVLCDKHKNGIPSMKIDVEPPKRCYRESDNCEGSIHNDGDKELNVSGEWHCDFHCHKPDSAKIVAMRETI